MRQNIRYFNRFTIELFSSKNFELNKIRFKKNMENQSLRRRLFGLVIHVNNKEVSSKKDLNASKVQ
jgi:hypothetical protein